jgi:hypothetical protein
MNKIRPTVQRLVRGTSIETDRQTDRQTESFSKNPFISLMEAENVNPSKFDD